ncbi:phosphate transporter [Chiua virens]|nr:phosphate transporter [Chiua virens]
MTEGFRVQRNEAGEEVVFLNDRRRGALAEIDKAAFSRFHVKLCLVAGVGFFTDAYDIFAIGIAATMLGFVYGTDKQDHLPALKKWQETSLKIAAPLGNLIGQLLFGVLADIIGRKPMYGVELAIMIVATFGQAVSGEGPVLNIIYILTIWRFILGIGVGGDYPLSAIITSEFASTRIRGRLMTAVFAFQGLGQFVSSFVGLVVVGALKNDIEDSRSKVDYAWRFLIGFGCVPAVLALYFRLTIPETPRFTMDIERHVGRATRDIKNALTTSGYKVYHDDDDDSYEPRASAPRASKLDFIRFFSKLKHWKTLLGTAYSWFALDIAFYTLTLDNTIILQRIGLGKVHGKVYQSLFNICSGNIITTLGGYIPGFVAVFFLIDAWGRKPIQLMGFIVLTVLFLVMGFADVSGITLMVLYCFANFFQNFGPNTTTFIIPGEVFPTRYRSTGHGISAACGKLGAVIAQYLYASTDDGQDHHKLQRVWKILSFVMLTGVLSTLLLPETKHRTLEELSDEVQETYITGVNGDGRSAVPNDLHV